MRVLTFVFLLIALILIVLTKETIDPDDYDDYDETKIKFQDVHAYRWVL
jgi:preprotein translocase subunit SecG